MHGEDLGTALAIAGSGMAIGAAIVLFGTIDDYVRAVRRHRHRAEAYGDAAEVPWEARGGPKVGEGGPSSTAPTQVRTKPCSHHDGSIK